VGVKSIAEHTVIELTGTDRPGLLSEVSAVLTETGCNVNAAEVWTHNLRVACVIYVTDEETSGPVANGNKLERIKNQLLQVMKSGDDEIRGAKTDFGTEVTHTERRLHQMMFADRDYEEALELPTTTTTRCSNSSSIRRRSLAADKEKPVIAIQSRNERGYSVINISCKDRPKLLFDIVCTLTDMQYVVFHATIDSNGTDAVQVCIHSILQELGFPESGRLEICHSFRDFLPPITLAHYGHMKNPALLFTVFA
jgi:UTP:GlnB (protein PII) uridylyltransferase